MDIENILDVLKNNGMIIIFVIMYLEGLNLTGIPAIVIIPTIGYFIGQADYSFVLIFSLSLLASVLGNLTYYGVSYKAGDIIYNYFYEKFPKTQKPLKKAMSLGDQYGSKACLIGRLIPGARTFVSLIAGVFKVKPSYFIIYSTLGIGIWTFALMMLGYVISLSI